MGRASQIRGLAAGRFPLASADFNGDGNMDLALTVKGQNWITLYFGNGSGGFFRQMRVPTGIGEATSLSAARLTNSSGTCTPPYRGQSCIIAFLTALASSWRAARA